MRENGFDVSPDASTTAKFAEMDYLRKSVGRTGLLALHQKLRIGHKELWQIHMAGK